jgi:hypothetical protein
MKNRTFCKPLSDHMLRSDLPLPELGMSQAQLWSFWPVFVANWHKYALNWNSPVTVAAVCPASAATVALNW